MEKVKDRLSKLDKLKLEIFNDINNAPLSKDHIITTKIEDIKQLDTKSPAYLVLLQREIIELTRVMQDTNSTNISNVKKSIYQVIDEIHNIVETLTAETMIKKEKNSESLPKSAVIYVLEKAKTPKGIFELGFATVVMVSLLEFLLSKNSIVAGIIQNITK